VSTTLSSGPTLGGKCVGPMDYLTRNVVVERQKGQTIYSEANPATHLYLVIKGAVCTSRSYHGREKEIAQIHGPDDFFGESSLLHANEYLERATALQLTYTMAWTAQEIEALIMRQPRLGVVLVQAFLHRSLQLEESAHSFAFEETIDRTARLMLSLCQRFGHRQEEGNVRLPPFTQALLAKCIGTSREIITVNMNELRRQGYLHYNRKQISVYEDALKERCAKAR
jgi:CRP-like cAMP-binding protein